VRRSVEESLERLGLDRVQLMYLHDPELHLSFVEAMAPGGAVVLALTIHLPAIVLLCPLRWCPRPSAIVSGCDLRKRRHPPAKARGG
jgi:hypothetical protein